MPVVRAAAGVLRLVLIERTEGGVHGGQLALPGGKSEPADESLLQTALREAEEEIGLDPALVDVLAEITPVYTRVSGFVVHPFLARVPPDGLYTANSVEVVDVLTPAVEELWDPAVRRELLFRSEHFADGLLVDGIPVGDRVLWGLTLRLLDDVVPRLLAGAWPV